MCRSALLGVFLSQDFLAHVLTRDETQVVASLDGHVLTRNLHIAVGCRDADTREGIDLHVAPVGGDRHVAPVGRARDLVDAVVVRQFETALKIFALLEVPFWEPLGAECQNGL